MTLIRRRSSLKSRYRDPITAQDRQHVRQRDGGCLGPRVGMYSRCEGSVQLDHIRASGALGKKSRSTPDNLATMCWLHHRYKTLAGKTWRPPLIALVARLEAGE